jgi:hypothetical protein
MCAHLDAVTRDPERLRHIWAADGVLEFPYATDDMTSRIEGVDALVAFFAARAVGVVGTFQPRPNTSPTRTRRSTSLRWHATCGVRPDATPVRAGLRDLDGAR